MVMISPAAYCDRDSCKLIAQKPHVLNSCVVPVRLCVSVSQAEKEKLSLVSEKESLAEQVADLDGQLSGDQIEYDHHHADS